MSTDKSSPRFLVFQCYGKEDIFLECAFALLTLSRLPDAERYRDVQIWIYTDHPSWFDRFADLPFELRFCTVTEAEIGAWRGPNDFVHRVKIEALRDFCARHEGAVLYLDTDMIFTHSIAHLFDGISRGERFMHTQEGALGRPDLPLNKKLLRFLQSNPQHADDRRIDGRTMMWNAGALGFRTSDAPLLDEILHYTDQLYTAFPKHVAEQFAFSYFFQKKGIVHAAAGSVFHYWRYKELRVHLRSFFDYFKGKSWRTLQEASRMIHPEVDMQYMISFYQRRSIWDKLRRAEWKPETPDWSLFSEEK